MYPKYLTWSDISAKKFSMVFSLTIAMPSSLYYFLCYAECLQEVSQWEYGYTVHCLGNRTAQSAAFLGLKSLFPVEKSKQTASNVDIIRPTSLKREKGQLAIASKKPQVTIFCALGYISQKYGAKFLQHELI